MIHRAIDIQSTRTADDGGYILTMAGLILIPLVIVVGFAVDIGGWYLQAAETQRAADASALAGVVWMPDFSAAEAEARATAQKNGFTHGVNATVDVAELDNRRIHVTITENTELYFTSLFLSPFDLTRGAEAEFVRPVPLGSPRNILGSGDLLTTNPENTWLAISGWCSSRENGDWLQAGYMATYDGADHQCDGSGVPTANPSYDAGGYWFSVTFEEQITGPVHLQVYNATWDNASGSVPYAACAQRRAAAQGIGEENLDCSVYRWHWDDPPPANPRAFLGGTYYNGGAGGFYLFPSVTTNFTVYDTDNTIFNRYDNTPLSTVSVAPWDTSYMFWNTLETLNDPGPGTYYIQVQTEANEDWSYSSNQFALRAQVGSTFSVCTTEVGQPDYSTSCPQIAAVDRLPVRASIDGGGDFYLASIEAVHAGKQLVVELFDPGEGANWMEILDPNGNPVTFDWETPCGGGVVAPSGGCSGTTSRLDVQGDGCVSDPQPGPNRKSDCKYNDRVIIARIDLPADYATQYGTNTWWKIRYDVSGTSTDRTTWGVELIGDPVRLTG